MKLAIVLFTIVSLTNGANHLEYHTEEFTAEERSLTDNLKKSINCIQTKLKDGDSEIDLPALHPITIADTSINLESLNIPYLKGSIRLHEFEAKNVVNWELTHAKLSTILVTTSLEVILDWLDVSMEGKYDLDASFLGIPITGTSKIVGSIQSATIDLKGKLFLTSISSVTLKPKLSSVKLTIGDVFIGPVNISEEINETIHVVIEWFGEHWEGLIESFNKYLKDLFKKRSASTYVNISNIINELAARCIKLGI